MKFKIIVFEHPEPDVWGVFCGFCPANHYYCSGNNTFDKTLKRIKRRIRFDLEQRFMFPSHLEKYGWEITENSVKPPIFTDEDTLRLAEKSYEITIDKYKILKVHVKIPEGKFNRNTN